MTRFGDVPEGAIFRVQSGQQCTMFGTWIKAKPTRRSNAHRPGNKSYRAWLGKDLKVMVLEGANGKE